MKKCPAIKVECNYCHKIGHFEKCCNQKNRDSSKSTNSKDSKKVHVLQKAQLYYDEDGNVKEMVQVADES